MASTLMSIVVLFLIGLIVSSVIIYVVTKLFGQSEGMDTAVAAALVGTIIYILAYYFLGQGLFASIIAGFVWLAALGGLYDMGWLRSAGVAVIVWVAAAFVSVVVPTVVGPL
jgi:hypothetical protein